MKYTDIKTFLIKVNAPAKECVAFAIFCGYQTLSIWENESDDRQPRLALEAASRWILGLATAEECVYAANAAYAVYAHNAAYVTYAAVDAACAAYATAHAAANAANTTVNTAAYVTYAAANAAAYASTAYTAARIQTILNYLYPPHLIDLALEVGWEAIRANELKIVAQLLNNDHPAAVKWVKHYSHNSKMLVALDKAIISGK